MVRFAIDERGIDLNGLDLVAASSTFKAFLKCVVEVASHGICFDDDLFTNDLKDGRTFWQLFDADVGLQLDHDDYERAAAAFGTMYRWYELGSPQPVDVEVQIDSGLVEPTRSIAWVHAQAGRGLGSASCLSAPHVRR